MAEILQFKPKQEPHGTGEAFCLKCEAEWVAVVPVGETRLQCPECKTMKGLLKYPYEVSEGEELRECNCGNQLFYLTLEGHLCPNCGIYQRYD